MLETGLEASFMPSRRHEASRLFSHIVGELALVEIEDNVGFPSELRVALRKGLQIG